jgi:hypothetical protein
MPKKHYSLILMLNIVISILGLLLTLLFAFTPHLSNENISWRKPLVGSIFSLICVLGIFASLFPSQCSFTLHFKTGNKDASRRTLFTSHHPDCKEFTAHIIRLKSHTICAACTGLLCGAIVALIFTFLYFFGTLSILTNGLLAILVGVAGVILGFLQFKFRSIIRLTLNTCFILGAFLTLVGVDTLTESLFTDFFLMTLIIFWIFTRIQISQWDHWGICSRCEVQCASRYN